MPIAIDPSMLTGGAEWQIGGLTGASGAEAGGAGGAAATGTNDTGFGSMLTDAIGSLSSAQSEAANASQAFAAGTISDPTEVVMAVERARLSMQMASTMRTKGVEAFQDIFHTQV